MELTLSERVALSLAIDSQIQTFSRCLDLASTESGLEFWEIRIQELQDMNEKLGFGL